MTALSFGGEHTICLHLDMPGLSHGFLGRSDLTTDGLTQLIMQQFVAGSIFSFYRMSPCGGELSIPEIYHQFRPVVKC